MLNEIDKSGHPNLVSYLRENAFSFSPVSVILSVGLYDLYYFEVCSLYTHFVDSLYHKLMLNFVKVFYASIEMIIWFLFFSLLMWCIILIDLWILNLPCISGINSTWSWFMILLVYCWIRFANFFWGFLHLCSEVISASYLFIYYFYCFILWLLCLVLVSGWFWHDRMISEVSFPLQFFGIVWEG